MANRNHAGGQAGFSLIELMIAMVVTMIVAGAIFGLLTAGNTAFRREPEMADRQQNIRVAMSVLGEDIRRAGTSLPRFDQVFENGLDGTGPMGPGGESTDEIQMLTTDDCNALTVCSSDGVNVVTHAPLSKCYNLPNVVFLIDTSCTSEDSNCSGIFWAEPPGAAGTASCGGTGGNNGHVNLPSGQSKLNYPGGPGFDPNFMMIGAVARYRVNIDAEGSPNLERSRTGGLDKAGVNTWDVIARGIEDLQVEYLNGSDVWTDEPGVAACASCPGATQADLDTIVQRVRITLSARAQAPNLQGQTVSSVGNAVRGQLVSEFAPKAAVVTLSMANREL